jgi:hypothetical protein
MTTSLERIPSEGVSGSEGRALMGVEIDIAGRRHFISAERRQILDRATTEREAAELAIDRALELRGVQAGWISLRQGEAGS